LLGQVVVIPGYEKQPTKPGAAIRFELTEPAKDLVIKIWDASGRLVRTIAVGDLPEGSHVVKWDGRNEAGEKVASGIYFFDIMGVIAPTMVGPGLTCLEAEVRVGADLEKAAERCDVALPSIYRGIKLEEYKHCVEEKIRDGENYLGALQACAVELKIKPAAERPPPRVGKFNWLWLLPVALFIAARRD